MENQRNTMPSNNSFPALDLSHHRELFVKQKMELGEWIGFETRNKYQISDAQGNAVAYAAEQSKGFLGFLLRQFLGHWRTFEVHIFDLQRKEILIAKQPFRFYFKRLEIYSAQNKFLGAVQQRFSILTKRFDIEDAREQTILEVSSPIWKLWTFPFTHNGQEVACIKKKWSGAISEIFTDRDNFMIEYKTPTLRNEEKLVIMASAIFIDLNYFEKKA